MAGAEAEAATDGAALAPRGCEQHSGAQRPLLVRRLRPLRTRRGESPGGRGRPGEEGADDSEHRHGALNTAGAADGRASTAACRPAC